MPSYDILVFDDILVYSLTLVEHVLHLETTFQLLLSNCFHLKCDKCTIGTQSIQYLGHIVSNNGVQPDLEKLDAVRNWPVPTSLKSLRGFLGLTRFYHRFVLGYASIAHPLTDLLKKDNFLWNDTAQTTFANLKNAFLTTPILTIPKFDAMFTIQTDASGIGMGVVLSQHDHPIAYFSKQFCPKLRNSSTYIQKLCAITFVVQKWRHYLLGHHSIIQTDQWSINELLSQTGLTPNQQVYLFKLLGFNFEIQYRPGKNNAVFDALSRIEDLDSNVTSSLLVLSIPQLDFMADFKSSLHQDP